MIDLSGPIPLQREAQAMFIFMEGLSSDGLILFDFRNGDEKAI